MNNKFAKKMTTAVNANRSKAVEKALNDLDSFAVLTLSLNPITRDLNILANDEMSSEEVIERLQSYLQVAKVRKAINVKTESSNKN